MKYRLSAVLIGGIAAIVFGQIASAADLPRKAPAYMPPPAPVFSWTGCYVGVNAGVVWGRSNINIPLYSPPSNFDIDDTSFIGGAQGGCNYQMNQFVVGLEGNWDWMDLSGDALSGGAFAERYAVKWNWDASIRGRLGYAPAGTPWLLYITGGVAWANLENAYFITPGFATIDRSGTHTGWTLGGGVEYQWTRNWVAGLEYRYTSYDSKTYVYLGPVDVDLKTNAVTARLSYLFH